MAGRDSDAFLFLFLFAIGWLPRGGMPSGCGRRLLRPALTARLVLLPNPVPGAGIDTRLLMAATNENCGSSRTSCRWPGAKNAFCGTQSYQRRLLPKLMAESGGWGAMPCYFAMLDTPQPYRCTRTCGL